jgi:WD40 repeat protein
LVGGTALKLLHVVAGVALLLAGGGIGWAALSSQPVAEPPVVPKQTVEKPTARDNASILDCDRRALPDGAVFRLGSRRYRIEGRNDLALPTPDGKYVLIQPQPSLSAYAAEGLMLVDIETGLRVRTFEQSYRVSKSLNTAAIRPAVFSPDGKKLYALGWDKSEETGDHFYVWADFDNACKRVLMVWNVETGKLTDEWELPESDRHGASLIGLNVSPDGKRLYAYGAMRMNAVPGQTVKGVPGLHVVDAANGKAIQTWDDAGNPAGFTAGGKELITFRKDAPITAHDPETGKVVRTFQLDGFISSVALSADGKTVAGIGSKANPDKTTTRELKLWDTATGKEIRTLPIDPKEARSYWGRLAFSADGKSLYLGGGSGQVFRWDLGNGESLSTWTGHQGPICDMFVRPGKNELVSAGNRDGAIRRWNSATGKSLSKTDAYVGELALARTPDSKALAICDVTGRMDVWNLASGRITQTLQLPADRRRELIFSPDGRSLVDATEDVKITIRDAATGKAVREIPAPERQSEDNASWCTTFSADGKGLFASRLGFGTRVFTWPECKIDWQSPEAFEAAAYSPDGVRIVCGAWHRKCHLRDPKTGEVLSEIPGEGLTSATYSPDGRRLATGHLSEGRGIPVDPKGAAWRIRDGMTGRVLKEVKEFQYVWDVAFSPSGWLLAVAGDKTLRVYDTATWTEVARFDGHEGTVHSVFFAGDDATLVSASSEDGTALVWSLKPPAGREPRDDMKLWTDLVGEGPALRRAVWAAAQHPDIAVKLFSEKWPISDKPLDADYVRKLLDKLDSGEFEARESAEAELMKLGRLVEDEVRKTRAETKSAEVKERANRILAKLSTDAIGEYPPEEARELRAVWALELAGTPEAKKLLEAWSKAKVGNRLSEASAAALKRMRRNDK